MKQLLQKLVFEANSSAKALLYQRGQCELTEEGCLRIKQGDSVSFDTYFNFFQPFIWRKYTQIEHLLVAVTIDGGGIVELWQADSSSGDVCLAQLDFVKSEPGEVVLSSLELAAAPAHLYIRVSAVSSDVLILDGGFYSPDAVKKEVNIACCYCTFKREKDIIGNCAVISKGIIKNKAARLYGKTAIYIADNGQTLTAEMFGDTQGIYLFKNKNYGGSAGFTRCMLEAMGYTGKTPPGSFSHLILMDDDAVIEAHVLEKTAALLENIRDEYANSLIGGAMLNLDVPYLQMVNGETFDKTGRYTYGRKCDLKLKDNVILNHTYAQGNYAAWFYTCIPCEFVKKKGFSLPLFFQFDDIEYSLRSHDEIIKINGLCVWHPDLTSKWRTNASYYGSRNSLVGKALYFKPSMMRHIVGMLKSIIGEIGVYSYEISQNRLRGARDYLRGIDWLINLDAEVFNTEVMRWQGYERIKLDPNIDIEYQEPLKKETPGRKLRMIKNWFLPANISRKYYHNDVGTREIDCYRTKEVCIVADSGVEAVLLKKSYSRAFSVCLLYLKICALAVMKFHKVSKEWRERHHEAESAEFWLKYLS